MVALPRIRRDLHLAKKSVHLGIIQAPSGTHRTVTGHGGKDVRNPVLENTASAKLSQFLGKVTNKRHRIRCAEKRRNAANQQAPLAEPLNLKTEFGKQGEI